MQNCQKVINTKDVPMPENARMQETQTCQRNEECINIGECENAKECINIGECGVVD